MGPDEDCGNLLKKADRIRVGGPPPNCRVGRSLIQRSKWVPSDFFRLFCSCRTCSPKPQSAPFTLVLGQSTSSNHEHGRGIHLQFFQGTYFVALTSEKARDDYSPEIQSNVTNLHFKSLNTQKLTCVSRVFSKCSER
jgi:hypothetical protein